MGRIIHRFLMHASEQIFWRNRSYWFSTLLLQIIFDFCFDFWCSGKYLSLYQILFNCATYFFAFCFFILNFISLVFCISVSFKSQLKDFMKIKFHRHFRLWCFARFSTICTIQKPEKHPWRSVTFSKVTGF